MNKIPMTVAGHKALDEELKRLKSVERPAVIQAISEAREHGDLSENAEYHAAKERQGWIEGRVQELEDKLARAQVIDIAKMSGDTVKFGATVTVLDEDTEEESTYQIVGDDESDVKSGQDLDLLAHRPRPYQQGSRRRGRSECPGRAEELRDHEGELERLAASPRKEKSIGAGLPLGGRLIVCVKPALRPDFALSGPLFCHPRLSVDRVERWLAAIG